MYVEAYNCNNITNNYKVKFAFVLIWGKFHQSFHESTIKMVNSVLRKSCHSVSPTKLCLTHYSTLEITPSFMLYILLAKKAV